MVESSTAIIQRSMLEIAGKFKLQPFSFSQEKQTQADVERYLSLEGLNFEREYRLSPQDIPDFLIKIESGNIALEVKINCARRAIYRQLERYAAHKEVNGIIL